MADLEVGGMKEGAGFLVAGVIAGLLLFVYRWLMQRANL